jgi:hypothetical protein
MKTTPVLNHYSAPVFHFIVFVFLNQVAESPASNGQAKLNDIHMINLARVSDVKEKKEAAPSTEQPLPLNLHRVSHYCITAPC